MRLKSFHGPTLQDAMNQVRAALGDDAIIIGTRDEEGGGVRVTAAIDDTPAPAATSASAALTLPDFSDEGEDYVDLIADSLHRHGTPPALAEKIVTLAMREPGIDAVDTLAAAFANMMRFAPLETNGKHCHILLMGPPGAGKTAMVGKLAARAAVAGKKVAVITTDLARAGGVAQLQAYTSTLKIPLLQVEDIHALPDALAVHATADVVFIDSMGRNPLDAIDAADMQLLVKLVGAPDERLCVLVLPAGLDAVDGTELASAFKQLGATHLLTTRLDLTRRLGSLLALGNDTRLFFCEASSSPAIATGLERLDAAALARMILPALATEAATTTVSPQNRSEPATGSETTSPDDDSRGAKSMFYGKR